MYFLKSPLDWTLDNGIKAEGDVLSLDNLIAEDLFGDAIIDPLLWAVDTVDGGGTSTVNESGGKLNIKTTTVGGGALLCYKIALDKTARWRVRFKQLARLNGVAMTLQDSQGVPVCEDLTTWHSDTLVELAPSGADDLYWGFWDTSGVQKLWQSNSGWSASGKAAAGVLNTALIYEIESDGVNLIMRLFDTNGEGLVFTSVPWSGVRVETDDIYLAVGDPFLGIWQSDFDVYEFQHFGDYPSGVIATMGEIEGQETYINQVPLIESADVGASIAYNYNLNRAGWSASKTLAELQAELVGQRFNFLDLKATFTSNGPARASLDINGGAIAGIAANFYMPLELVELPGIEVIEI